MENKKDEATELYSRTNNIIAISVVCVFVIIFFYSYFIVSENGYILTVLLIAALGLKKGIESEELRDVYNLRKVKISFDSLSQKCEMALAIIVTLITNFSDVQVESYVNASAYFFSQDFFFFLLSLLISIVYCFLFYRFFFLNSLRGKYKS